MSARYGKPKRAALSPFTFDPDLSPMRFHHFLGDGEAQPCALRVRAGHAKISFKEVSLVFREDSFSRIRNFKTYDPVGRQRPHVDASTARSLPARHGANPIAFQSTAQPFALGTDEWPCVGT